MNGNLFVEEEEKIVETNEKMWAVALKAVDSSWFKVLAYNYRAIVAWFVLR